MLRRFLPRRTAAPLVHDGTDPLRIRNLLDLPELQAVMTPPVGDVVDEADTGTTVDDERMRLVTASLFVDDIAA